MFKRKPRYKLKLVNDQYQLYVNHKPSDFYFKTIDDAKAFTESLINPKWRSYNLKYMHLLHRNVRKDGKNIQIIQTSINQFESVSVRMIVTEDFGKLSRATSLRYHSSFSEANEYINNRFDIDIKPKKFIKI